MGDHRICGNSVYFRCTYGCDRRELEEIDEQIEKLSVKLEEHKKQITFLTEDREKQKGIRDELNTEIQNMNIRMNTYTLNLEQVQAKLAEVERGFASINRENGELAAQIDEINANKQELKDNNQKQEEAIHELEAEIAKLEQAVTEEKGRLQGASDSINKLNLE